MAALSQQYCGSIPSRISMQIKGRVMDARCLVYLRVWHNFIHPNRRWLSGVTGNSSSCYSYCVGYTGELYTGYSDDAGHARIGLYLARGRVFDRLRVASACPILSFMSRMLTEPAPLPGYSKQVVTVTARYSLTTDRLR